MHPVANIRGSASDHLSGRRIVLAVSGSIAAVKTVELARELTRHGADVHAVMTKAATEIVTPDALWFATGNPVITKLTGAVEHVALLGDVPERADLFLVAPATANTVGKMALGLDDTPVTTCATTAFGSGVPVVVAPAMHDAMLRHEKVQANVQTLIEDLGVTWVEPRTEEKKAKLADIEAIVEAVIHRLAAGPLVGKRALVIGGATAEPIDPVRLFTNRSSGRSAVLLAKELHRLGAHVDLWYGHGTEPAPTYLAVTHFGSHADLMGLVTDHVLGSYDQVWMPAAISDYAPDTAPGKIGSEQAGITLALHSLGKVIAHVRKAAPQATLVAFKAESNPNTLLEKARSRIDRYEAQFIVANTSDAFGADDTELTLLAADGTTTPFQGPKERVLRGVVRAVAGHGTARDVQVAP